MPRERGSFLARLGASSEFKHQAVLTIKVVAGMLVMVGGLWVADLLLAP
jgi:hypothetical protein